MNGETQGDRKILRRSTVVRRRESGYEGQFEGYEWESGKKGEGGR